MNYTIYEQISLTSYNVIYSLSHIIDVIQYFTIINVS
jgi:hypothetical protein